MRFTSVGATTFTRLERGRLLARIGKLDAAAEEVAEATGISVDEAKRVIKISKHPISLDRPIGEDEDSNLSDFIEDTGAASPAQTAAHAMLREVARRVEEVSAQVNGVDPAAVAAASTHLERSMVARCSSTRIPSRAGTALSPRCSAAAAKERKRRSASASGDPAAGFASPRDALIRRSIGCRRATSHDANCLFISPTISIRFSV